MKNQIFSGVVTGFPYLTALDLYVFPFLTVHGKELKVNLSPSTPSELVDLLYPNAQLHITVFEDWTGGMMLYDCAAVTEDKYKLPEYEGYTVDFRLREFRKLQQGELPEFIPFSEPMGKGLLREYIRSLQNRSEKQE